AELGRQALAGLPGVDDSVMAVLRDAGIGSPPAVVAAGIEKLGALEGVGDRANALHRAAADWVPAHAPPPDDEALAPETPDGRERLAHAFRTSCSVTADLGATVAELARRHDAAARASVK